MLLIGNEETDTMSAKINDLQSLRKHGRQLDAELEAVFAKYGLKMGRRSARIGSGKVKYGIELGYDVVQPDGSVKDAKAIDFDNYALMMGVQPHVKVGSSFFYGGETYTVVGLYPKKRKRPVAIRSDSGVERICAPAFVNNFCKAPVAA